MGSPGQVSGNIIVAAVVLKVEEAEEKICARCRSHPPPHRARGGRYPGEPIITPVWPYEESKAE
jgi:hypothetical protein